MKKTTSMKCGIVAGGLIGPILAGTTAFAALDAKDYPGSFCVQHSSSGGTLKHAVEAHVYNGDGTTSTRALCPVLADNRSSWNTDANTEIRVRDGHNGKSVDCCFRVADKTSGVYSSCDATLDADVGNYTLDGFAAGADPAWNNTAYFDCTLPDSEGDFSRIYNYRGEEN